MAEGYAAFNPTESTATGPAPAAPAQQQPAPTGSPTAQDAGSYQAIADQGTAERQVAARGTGPGSIKKTPEEHNFFYNMAKEGAYGVNMTVGTVVDLGAALLQGKGPLDMAARAFGVTPDKEAEVRGQQYDPFYRAGKALRDYAGTQAMGKVIQPVKAAEGDPHALAKNISYGIAEQAGAASTFLVGGLPLKWLGITSQMTPEAAAAYGALEKLQGVTAETFNKALAWATAGAGIGQGVARTNFPDSSTAEFVGSLAGAFGLSGVRGLLNFMKGGNIEQMAQNMSKTLGEYAQQDPAFQARLEKYAALKQANPGLNQSLGAVTRNPELMADETSYLRGAAEQATWRQNQTQTADTLHRMGSPETLSTQARYAQVGPEGAEAVASTRDAALDVAANAEHQAKINIANAASRLPAGFKSHDVGELIVDEYNKTHDAVFKAFEPEYAKVDGDLSNPYTPIINAAKDVRGEITRSEVLAGARKESLSGEPAILGAIEDRHDELLREAVLPPKGAARNAFYRDLQDKWILKNTNVVGLKGETPGLPSNTELFNSHIANLKASGKMPPVQDTFNEVRSMRSRLLAELAEENAKWPKNHLKIARLNTLREGIESSWTQMEDAGVQDVTKLRETNTNYRAAKDRLERGSLGQLSQAARDRGPGTAPSTVVEKFWGSGGAVPSNIRALKEVPGAYEILQKHVKAEFALFVDTDKAGNFEFNITRAQNWMRSNRDKLAEMPEVQTELQDVLNKAEKHKEVAEEYGKLQQDLGLTKDEIDSRRTGIALGTAERTPAQHVGDALKGPGGDANVAKLWLQVQRTGDAAAIRGFRKAVIDNMHPEKTAVLTGTDIPILDAKDMGEYMADHEKLFQQLYTPEQRRSIETVRQGFEDMSATSPPGAQGQLMSRDPEANRARSLLKTVLHRVLSTARHFASPSTVLTQSASDNMLRLAQSYNSQQWKDMFGRLMYDPDLAVSLVKAASQPLRVARRNLNASLLLAGYNTKDLPDPDKP